MKLRQKLAMVLAAAMVVTAVPVTTMAKSTNEISKTISAVEGTPVNPGELYLNVDIDGTASQDKPAVFFLTTEAFEFNKDEYKSVGQTTGVYVEDNVKVEILSSTEARVTVTTTDKVAIPVIGTVKKGTPAIIVDGQDSVVTSGKYTLTASEIAGDKVYVATAGDAKNVSIEGVGEIADITIEEKVAGSFYKDQTDGDGVTFEIELPNRSDLEFDGKVKVDGKRGHANNKEIKIAQKKLSNDGKSLIVTVTGFKPDAQRGSIVLSGIGVTPENPREDCSVGEVKVEVKDVVASGVSEKLTETELVVANVADFDVNISVVDDKKVELVGGKEAKKVNVKLKETAIGSLDRKRDVYFTVDGAHVTTDAAITVKVNDTKVDGAAKVNAKTGEITLNTDKIDPEKINTITMEFEVYADVSQSGPITITAESRSFKEEAIKAEIGTVTAPFKVEAEAMTVKVGLQGQVGGKITIAETEEEMFDRGEVFYVAPTKYFSIEDAKVEVTEGDLEIESEVQKDGTIKVTVKRPSDEASTITISDVEVTTNRMVPEGSFDVEIYGEAISEMNVAGHPGYDKDDEEKTDAITVKDFFVVGTKNTEDLPNAAAAKEIVLKIGDTAYTVNGEAKTADAAAYIDANNRTMVPVKFVAEEFGKVDFGTIDGVGTVTIFKDGSVLQFQNGSNIMLKDGVKIPMDTKVVITKGRTYVPFKYVADGLGIGYSYDAAEKSITFTNQVK